MQLIDFATDANRPIVQAVEDCHGDQSAAAESLGIPRGTVYSAMSRTRKRAATAGWSPEHDMTKTVPDGYHVKGVSTYYDRTGKVRGQWVKSQKDPAEDRIKAFLELFEERFEPYRGEAEPVPPPQVDAPELLNVFTLGDPHVGMLAWPEETGEAYDLRLAESQHMQAIDHLVEQAPPAEQALLINVGDFFHTDRLDNRTAASGHALDVDSRLPKMFRVGIRLKRRMIDRLLQKFDRVRDINIGGNHDEVLAMALSMYLAAVYERDPRVTIDTSPAAYRYHRFGDCLFGVCHGHGAKPQDLPLLMANDRPLDWGECTHRHWYTGHLHHEIVKGYPGCKVETLETLAPGDAWHRREGYRSRRSMRCDVWHRSKGLQNKIFFQQEQL